MAGGVLVQPKTTFEERRELALRLVREVAEETRHAGQSCWDMQTFYTGIVSGFLAVAVTIAGLSPATLSIAYRATAVCSISLLGAGFAAVGRYSLAIQSFYLVRSRNVRRVLLEDLAAGWTFHDLPLYLRAMELTPWNLQAFRDDPTDSGLRKRVTDGMGRHTLPTIGVRGSMFVSMAILGVLAGVVSGIAAYYVAASAGGATGLDIAAIIGLSVAGAAIAAEWVVLSGLRQRLLL